MNESQALRKHPAGAGSGPNPVLEALPGAVALFDTSLALIGANARFRALCPSLRECESLGGLLACVGVVNRVPLDGESATYMANCCAGGSFELTVSRNGDYIGAVARSVSPAEQQAPLASALEALAERGRAQDALLALSRELALCAGEDEMVAAIARCIRLLFPKRHFCIRIVDPTSFELTSLYAEGQLLEASRDRLELRRGAADKAQIDPRLIAADRLVLTDDEPLVFAHSARGFATPFAAAGQFFGIVNLEYPRGLVADFAQDEKLLVQLASLVAIGVRNAKLIEELTFVRKHLEELIENANALILVVNCDLQVVVFNRALTQVTGYEKAEVIGRNILELVPEGGRDTFARVMAASLRGEAVTGRETRLRLKSGAELGALFSTSAVLAPSGAVEGVIAIGQDITRQKELERRIVQAEKLASLGQLAAGVVHEINNPLTTITMYAEALLQLAPVRRTDPGDVEKLRRIHESAERILKFARDLTSYAKPAQDRPQMLDLHHVLDQAARYCEHAFKQSGAVLDRRYCESLPAIRGVRSNLVQVFVNLLTNACHALPEGGGRIELATRVRERGVEIEVHDSGVGIEKHLLPRIFEPFFTTKAEGRGTGLGLTIVQGIVEKHGGSIRVASASGQGTSFTIHLPINCDEE